MGKCANCGKSLGLFNREFKCSRCGKVFCSSCVVKAQASKSVWELLCLTKNYKKPKYSITKFEHYLCPDCISGFNREVDNMEEAIESDSHIELVSINYRGKKRYNGDPIDIRTYNYKDKEEAKEELKILARYYNCDMVIDVECIRDVDEEETEHGGTHKFSIWRYTGSAVHRK